MASWIADEHGNQTFTHEGWEVQIWGPEWPNSRITVTSPCTDHEVMVDPDGLWVRGADTRRHDDVPEAFTIPWAVIEAIAVARAIIEARAIVG
jgi:hypothetical protein